VVRASGGEVRQQFALLFRAQAVGGTPRGDQHETCDAAWVPMADLAGLSMEPPVRIWIAQASRRQGRRTSADPETQRPERRMASRSAYHVSSPTTAVIELPTIAGQRPRRYPGSGGPRC